MIAAIAAICLLCAGVSTTDPQEMPSGQQTAIDLKVAPWNPEGLPANYFVYSLQRSGGRLLLGTMGRVFLVGPAGSASLFWEEEGVRFYHSLSYDVFGLQVLFRYDKKPLALLAGAVWCELNESFRGDWAKDVTAFRDVLAYTAGSDSVVSLRLQDLLAKKCDGATVVSRNAASHLATWGADESLFVALRNNTVRRGEAEKNLTLDGLQTWTCSEQVGDDTLLAGFNSSSKTNYFVLLDRDLNVVDSASYRLEDVKGTLR